MGNDLTARRHGPPGHHGRMLLPEAARLRGGMPAWRLAVSPALHARRDPLAHHPGSVGEPACVGAILAGTGGHGIALAEPQHVCGSTVLARKY